MCATALAYQVASKDNLKYFAQEEHFIGVDFTFLLMTISFMNSKLVADN